ncbi:peptide-methionine (R)-S-oxide reductase [uncultured Tateyamaria sp.]|uniref:peptide-methionine (R)-S-oxide reductase n=1 Tax=uncultured Tateyamaria sp. TaxID=455651 RepID=UPI002613B185|nr:peptide-methionine (R)-S-oxide reductase [uncultured Tateyamaria sp.]
MTKTNPIRLNRRGFLAATGSAAVALAPAASARVPARASTSDFSYDINYTDAEWQSRLTEDEFAILREGFTEKPRTSPLWQETRTGTYHCKGCGLYTYDARWKVPLDKGWVFFEHSQQNTVLTDIDGPTPEYGQSADATLAVAEVHCSRCGSHLGHWLIVEKQMVHCINGTALNFHPEIS